MTADVTAGVQGSCRVHQPRHERDQKLPMTLQYLGAVATAPGRCLLALHLESLPQSGSAALRRMLPHARLSTHFRFSSFTYCTRRLAR